MRICRITIPWNRREKVNIWITAIGVDLYYVYYLHEEERKIYLAMNQVCV